MQISPANTAYMNETLYSWTFNFHKVVRQQNSGAVEDFILPYSAVYLRIQKWKNYWNRSTFAKVIVKIKVARFCGPRCIYATLNSARHCRSTWGVEFAEFLDTRHFDAEIDYWTRLNVPSSAYLYLRTKLTLRWDLTVTCLLKCTDCAL